MNSVDRLVRIAEIEELAKALIDKGWSVEEVVHVDEDGEPFRTTIKVRVADPGRAII